MIEEHIAQARQLIEEADAILITAGAGIGVDSGLPDFRGNTGLWKAYPVLQKAGHEFTQVESGYLFTKRPKLAWGFYGYRIKLYKETKPHDGFRIMYDYLTEQQKNYFIFTSNVDAHFQQAGFSKDKIYEVHGSVEYLQCIDNCNEKIFKNNLRGLNIDMKTLETEDVPYCQDCTKVIVPNILFFGGTNFNENRIKYKMKFFYNGYPL